VSGEDGHEEKARDKISVQVPGGGVEEFDNILNCMVKDEPEVNCND